MSPVMIVIEAILYELKENSDLWVIRDVKTALKKLRENEKTARFEERLAALIRSRIGLWQIWKHSIPQGMMNEREGVGEGGGSSMH